MALDGIVLSIDHGLCGSVGHASLGKLDMRRRRGRVGADGACSGEGAQCDAGDGALLVGCEGHGG